MLRTPLPSSLAVLFVGTALASASPAFAQTAQGQFTPDTGANAPIQLHMPVHLHPRAARRRVPAPAKPKPAQAAESATSAAPQNAEAAPIPFGTNGSAAAAAPLRRAAATAKSRPGKPTPSAVAYAPPPSRAERRKAVQEVLSGSASAFPSSGTAADVSAPDAAIPFSFDAATVPEAAPKKAPAPRPAAQANHSSGAPVRPRTNVAALEPPAKVAAPEAKPKTDPHAGLVKQGEILFAASSTDPEADGAGQLKTIAGSLNTALESESARVEIEAFGGPPGDKSSDARRLSLRRALAIRQLLIDSGIPASRIDVRAQGGIDDHGNADRVDVYLSGAS